MHTYSYIDFEPHHHHRQHDRHPKNKIMYAHVELDTWPFLPNMYTQRHGHYQTANIYGHKYRYGHLMLQFYVNISIFYPPEILQWFHITGVFV